MIGYTSGLISYNLIPNENVLIISVSDENGTPLRDKLPIIVNEYKKYITCICLTDKTDNKNELIQCLKDIKKLKQKTCLDSRREDITQINQNILDELNYVILNKKIMFKDYSPFGDIEDWVEIT